jgi:hypothetical protein
VILVKSLLIAITIGLLVGLLAHTLGVLLIVLGITLVVAGIVLTLTAIGAVIGIPLGFLGAVAIAFGAVGASGTIEAVVLGFVAGLLIYLRLERRQARAIH